MRKPAALLFALISCQLAFGQKLPDAFNIGNYVEVLPGDSIKIWYNCSGAICNRSCANFYRIGKIDPERIGLTGEFHDYDSKGHLIYKAQVREGRLTGKAYFYYPNEQIKETGDYENDERNGIWKYYYPNGNAEKIFDFQGATPNIIQAYNINGDATVADGNGTYSGRFVAFKQCDGSWPISGPVKDGKMNGEWKFATLSKEMYDNGKFVQGIDDKSYGGNRYRVNEPRIVLSGFYANENTLLDQNYIGCPGDQVTFFRFKSKSMTEGFYPQLIKKIKSYPNLKNQWIMVGIDFNKVDRIKDLNVYSSKNDTTLEVFVYNYIKNLKGWQTGSTTSESNPQLFFTVNIDLSLGDERVLIPAEYLIRRQMNAMKQANGN